MPCLGFELRASHTPDRWRTNRLRHGSAGETGDPRENPPTSGIIRQVSHLQKSGATRPRIEPSSPWWEASILNAQPPWPPIVCTVVRPKPVWSLVVEHGSKSLVLGRSTLSPRSSCQLNKLASSLFGSQRGIGITLCKQCRLGSAKTKINNDSQWLAMARKKRGREDRLLGGFEVPKLQAVERGDVKPVQCCALEAIPRHIHSLSSPLALHRTGLQQPCSKLAMLLGNGCRGRAKSESRGRQSYPRVHTPAREASFDVTTGDGPRRYCRIVFPPPLRRLESEYAPGSSNPIPHPSRLPWDAGAPCTWQAKLATASRRPSQLLSWQELRPTVLIWAAVNSEVLISDDGDWGRGWGRGDGSSPRRPADQRNLPTCEGPVARPGIEPGSLWWRASVLNAQPPRPLKRSVNGNIFCEIVVCAYSRISRYDGNTARLARRSDEALGVRVSVARIAPSLLDFGRGVPTWVHPTLKVEAPQPVHTALADVRRMIVEISPRHCSRGVDGEPTTHDHNERYPLRVGTSKGLVCSDNLGAEVFASIRRTTVKWTC
ncbi:hypothetical protein PR048_023793 [Dryococelus australis]|uniref:Uncharacterized protein n=1 Tax=Dryococelus australis TaxID=614101 RepID=A0ABQ9GV60_9NEOP|nr:hypothetical protein PR048_023793 [Dryococelus australis]